MRGISEVSAGDIAHAQELGYRIKLLGISKHLNGEVVQMVEPCLVPEDSTMAAVEDVFNAVYVEGDFSDTGLAVGRGAGAGPTASAVVADLVDIARGVNLPVFGIPAAALEVARWGDLGDLVEKFYMNLTVLDRPGVLADITAIMRDHNVSMEAVLQKGRDPDNPVSIVMISHETRQDNIRKAVDAVARLDCCIAEPMLMRIETF